MNLRLRKTTRMQINKIILENFGLYRGKKTFDLTPNNQRNKTPIILFGGRNGAGKTTFLNSIRLALYGKRSLGERISNSEYNDYLIQKIHRHPEQDFQARNARVALEFDFVTQGTKDNYYIERSWENISGKAKEAVFIRKNEDDLDDVDSEFWDTFIYDIIPERLSQLFFFDGEKIQDIADDIKGNSAIAEAIQTLLGLDLVEKLKADLNIYISKEAKKVSSSDDKKRLNQLDKEITKYRSKNEEYFIEESELNAKIAGVKSDINRLENDLRAKGAEFSETRNQNKDREVQLQTRIEECEKAIQHECANLFPLALCPNISTTLITQLNNEQKVKKQKILTSEFKSLSLDLQNLIQQSDSFNNDSAKNDLLNSIQTQITQRSKVDQSIREVHHLSETDSQSHISTLKQAKALSTKRIKDASANIKRLDNELQKVRKSINQAPEDILLQDTYKDLATNNKGLGELENSLSTLQESTRLNKIALDQLLREQKKIEEKQREQQGHWERADEVNRVNKALSEYNQRLTDMKVDQLRHEVVNSFNHIARKDEFVQDVIIDKQSFEVTLIDSKGKVIPKEDLSSGEKQIFAIAFLWALAKTSGRPLPVIVDTPLGRLDSEHRLNLVENYFPSASHQVILFSTDTEVDENLYSILEPHISHSYHLRFDKKNFETVAEEQYFWKELSHA